MKKNSTIVFILFMAIALLGLQAFAQQKKQNVIIVLTDDQGYGDLSVLGNPILKTPNLDKLHDQSVRFTDFHVSSVCTPSRGQLLTGKDACRNGAFAWAYSREIIHTDVPTMAEIFRDNGYATGHFGKWHLGDNYPYRPMDRGFDESIKHGGASVYQTPDYWDNDYVDDYYEHNGVMKQYKGYCTDVWFEESKKFIRKSKEENKPFFVYLPTNTPHDPMIVEERYSREYYDTLEKGFEEVPEFANKNKGYYNNTRTSQFFGMIANIDENMGKLDEFLKTEGLYEDTILIFMTDNGGTQGVHVYNAGLRGKKGSLYEGGHRVPFFMRWPKGNLKPKNIAELTHAQDVFPTLSEMCKLEHKINDFDGVSLKALIDGERVPLPGRMLVMQNAMAPMTTKYYATVLWDNWRLVKNKELYNVEEDLIQANDVSADYPQITKAMQAYYEQWWEGIQEPLHRIPSIPVGGQDCEEITITCFDWHGFEGAGNVTVQPTVRQGGSANGHWNIEVLEEGTYEIRCSRWPLEARTPITSGMPAHKTLTITYPEGKALPIKYAKIEMDGQSKEIKVRGRDLYASTKLKLKKGKYKLRTTFFGGDDELVCGAYYAYILKK